MRLACVRNLGQCLAHDRTSVGGTAVTTTIAYSIPCRKSTVERFPPDSLEDQLLFSHGHPALHPPQQCRRPGCWVSWACVLTSQMGDRPLSCPMGKDKRGHDDKPAQATSMPHSAETCWSRWTEGCAANRLKLKIPGVDKTQDTFRSLTWNEKTSVCLSGKVLCGIRSLSTFHSNFLSICVPAGLVCAKYHDDRKINRGCTYNEYLLQSKISTHVILAIGKCVLPTPWMANLRNPMPC